MIMMVNRRASSDTLPVTGKNRPSYHSAPLRFRRAYLVSIPPKKGIPR
ncbi:MAG: hypothetical protein A4E30_00085 [Methanomassiliicoccales archaeon PtaB.Bin215]|nr:MAG: hypothetical protein A4E30_00085 [Methanomassiliicoccales archaeon PtaB.Bin215]